MFFRITGLDTDGEPVGAQNVPLMPGRSIAVDKTHVYGTPFYIEADLPIDSARPVTPFRRLMIAQDTGSAIVGPARADLYWGAGDVRGAHRGPHPPSRPLRHAAAARTRHGRGRQDHAAAAREAANIAETEIKKSRSTPNREAAEARAKTCGRAKRAGQNAPYRSRSAAMTADDVKPRRRKFTADEHTL